VDVARQSAQAVYNRAGLFLVARNAIKITHFFFFTPASGPSVVCLKLLVERSRCLVEVIDRDALHILVAVRVTLLANTVHPVASVNAPLANIGLVRLGVPSSSSINASITASITASMRVCSHFRVMVIDKQCLLAAGATIP
jgi:hypothetical protein